MLQLTVLGTRYPRIESWLELTLNIDLESIESPDEIERILRTTRIGRQKNAEAIIEEFRQKVLEYNIEKAIREKRPKIIWEEYGYRWAIERWSNGWTVYAERDNGRFVKLRRLE